MRSVATTLITLILAGCQKPTVVLRDPEVYRNEIAFFQMSLEQDTELLETHLKDGSCQCVEGAWSTDVCEMTALNILVIQHRLQFHVDMMLYNAKLLDKRPEREPEVPEPSTLCPTEP